MAAAKDIQRHSARHSSGDGAADAVRGGLQQTASAGPGGMSFALESILELLHCASNGSDWAF